MKKLKPETFIRVWQRSGSLTEVSVRLARMGHEDIGPDEAAKMAWSLKRFGVDKLKDIPRSDLPDLAAEPGPATVRRKVVIDACRELVATEHGAMSRHLYLAFMRAVRLARGE